MNVTSGWKPQAFVSRVVRAALFDRQVYNEVVADVSATVPALAVVLVAWTAVALGDLDDGGLGALAKIPAWMVFGLASWVVGTHLTYLIGTKVLKTSQTNVSWSGVARAMGFAQAPGVLRGH